MSTMQQAPPAEPGAVPDVQNMSAFSTGQGFGWHQRTAAHWHGTDAFT
jgi:hypothetical protein